MKFALLYDKTLQILTSISIFIFFIFTGVVDAQYAMQVHLSTLASLEGGEVTVTCDVSIRQTNKSFFIIWVKRTHGEEVEIGTNDHINGIFNNTGRYKARYELHRPNDFTRVTFYLKITNVKSSDSGDIGCRIPNNIDVLRKFSVFAPIKSIRLASKDVDNSQAVVYENGQSVRVREGEMHRFYCHINGSYPEPQVSIKIGDQDITHHFNISSKMLKEGSAKGIQSFYYKVDAKAHRLAMEYDYNGKELSCIAKIADYDKLTRKAGIRVFLSEYRPKFQCSKMISAAAFQPNVVISCPVQSNPPVTSVRYFWKRSTQGEMVMSSKEINGLYTTNLLAGKSVYENIMTLRIERLFPQTFRSYFFEATNQLGTSVYKIDLINSKYQHGSAQQSTDGAAIHSFLSSSISIQMLVIFTRFVL